MAADKKFMLAVAGAGALGAAYSAASSPTRPATKPANNVPDNKARDKKDMGLGGARIGNKLAAGGTERAIDPSNDRKVETTPPRDKRPSGVLGVGAGVGGTSARTVELPMPNSSSSTGIQSGSESAEPKSRSNLPTQW